MRVKCEKQNNIIFILKTIKKRPITKSQGLYFVNGGDQAGDARAGRRDAEEGESSTPVQAAPAVPAVMSIRHSFKL